MTNWDLNGFATWPSLKVLCEIALKSVTLLQTMQTYLQIEEEEKNQYVLFILKIAKCICQHCNDVSVHIAKYICQNDNNVSAHIADVFVKIVKYSFPNCFEKCELLQTNASLSANGSKHICLMFCRPICNCNRRKTLLSLFFHFAKANNCPRVCPHCVSYYHDQLARFLLMFQ